MRVAVDELFPGRAGGVVRSMFVRMGIAEQVIEDELADDGRAVFEALVTPESLREFGDWVYRAHAVELCRRHRAGGKAEEATAAEVLAAMYRTSLDAPLNQQGRAVYTWCFRECARLAGNRAVRDIATEIPGDREPWPGATNEMVAGCRRRLRAERSFR